MSAKVSTLLVAVWLVVTWRDAHSAALPIAPVTHVSGDTPETGFQWVQTDVRGKRDVFPSQIEKDPSSWASYFVTGLWSGKMTAGDHILEAATCGSQACSMFLLKMAHGEEGEAEKVEWARPILNAQEDAAIEHSSTGVGPDGSVFVDGQFCFGTIEVGDQRNRIPLTLEDNEDCLGFVAKYNASGDLLWARKLSAGSEMMKTGNLKVHPSTGDVFMAGMFMGSEVEFGTFRASSTRNSDTDPADIGRGWYEDTDTSYMHHYSMWIAKLLGGNGDVEWLATVNTSSTLMADPSLALDPAEEKLYISLSTHDPPFNVWLEEGQPPVTGDGFVISVSTAGKVLPEHAVFQSVQDDTASTMAPASIGNTDNEGPTVPEGWGGGLSSLKYLTSVEANAGAIYVSGSFYGALRIQGVTVHSRSTECAPPPLYGVQAPCRDPQLVSSDIYLQTPFRTVARYPCLASCVLWFQHWSSILTYKHCFPITIILANPPGTKDHLLLSCGWIAWKLSGCLERSRTETLTFGTWRSEGAE
mmetsp:Transcript_38908/g.110115  ORF Transcript_38908/g.110115 Transcript_38908/m.110115 type:complete len:528 (-) Transcript_38908:1874-3457(-)